MSLIDLSRTIEHRTPAHPSHPPVIMIVSGMTITRLKKLAKRHSLQNP